MSSDAKISIDLSNANNKMKYTRLGSTGLMVSKICLGCMSYSGSDWGLCPWALDEAPSRALIKKALELNINFFDTANAYNTGRSEEVLGRALKDFAADRTQLVIATKVYFPMGPGPNQSGLSRKHIFDAVDASLKRLQVDYIDLYQVHRFDPNTPIEETMEALHDLVKSGKVRYIGASSMYTWQFAKMNHWAKLKGFTAFVSMQNLYNLLYREEEREMIPFCADAGIAMIPWSPLANGLLTGKRPLPGTEEYKKAQEMSDRAKVDTFANMLYHEPEDVAVVEAVKNLAEKKKVTAAQVALAWLIGNKTVSAPIVGCTKEYQLVEAVDALTVELTPEERKEVEANYRPKRILPIVYDGGN